MFTECFLVLRAQVSAVRTRTGKASRVDYAPAYACREYADAAMFRDSLTRETGIPAVIGRVLLWEGAGDGEG